MPDPLSPEEARERLVRTVCFTSEGGAAGLPSASTALDAILATVNALAALVDWPKLLEAGERAGKVSVTEVDSRFCEKCGVVHHEYQVIVDHQRHTNYASDTKARERL